jgi:hypothetical protein
VLGVVSVQEGNPSVSDVVNLFNNNEDMKSINFSVSFDPYSNKFSFKNEGILDGYFHFKGSSAVYGFEDGPLYRIKAVDYPYHIIY